MQVQQGGRREMWLLKNTELGGRHIGPTVAERVRAGIWLFTQIYGRPIQ